MNEKPPRLRLFLLPRRSGHPTSDLWSVSSHRVKHCELAGSANCSPNCNAMTFRRDKVSGLMAMLVEGGRKVVSDQLWFRDFTSMPGAALAIAAAQARPSRFIASSFLDSMSSDLRGP